MFLHPQTDITKDEMKVFKELRQGKACVILTVDRGVAILVVDKQDYIKKMERLVEQMEMYRIIQTDPTKRQKSKLISLFKSFKAEAGIQDSKYKTMYPTGAGFPQFYGLLVTYKKGVPLMPIVSNRGTITYGVAKELARILRPLVMQVP